MAPRNRVTTSAQQYKFRKTQNEVRLLEPLAQRNYFDRNLRRNMSNAFYDTGNEFTFGKPSRPQTPMRTVLNGVYGKVAAFTIASRQEGLITQKRAEKAKVPSKAHTRASTYAQDRVLRNTLTANAALEQPEMFKLSKFKAVTAREKHHVNEKRA